MAIYHFQDAGLATVPETSFSAEGVLERQHLQAALKAQIDVVAPGCLVIAEEFSEWTGSRRRIDLLAVDRQANLVVIELKRTVTGEHMELQAIRYAAMVSTLRFRRAVEVFQQYLQDNEKALDAEEQLLNFLGWDEPREDEFALDVRIVLAASDFSEELTTSVMWLNERKLDIRCVRLIPHRFEDKILINVQKIIPLPESESYQIKIRQQSEERREARKSTMDHTRYLFNGRVFNKRRLVLAVIQQWVSDSEPRSFEALLEAFPQDTRSGGIFVPVSQARAIYERHGIARHFLDDNETLKFPDSSEYAISNQWGKGNIDKFLACAKQLGMEIEETD